MFASSKILWNIVDPETMLAVALLVGTVLLWTRWRRVGRALTTGAILVLCLVSIFPVGHWLYHALENRFPPLAVVPADTDGIIVLGGSFDLNRTAARDQVALKDSAERLTTFVTLARRHGDARLLFAGGSAACSPRPPMPSGCSPSSVSTPRGSSSRAGREAPTRTLSSPTNSPNPRLASAGCSSPRRLTCRGRSAVSAALAGR